MLWTVCISSSVQHFSWHIPEDMQLPLPAWLEWGAARLGVDCPYKCSGNARFCSSPGGALVQSDISTGNPITCCQSNPPSTGFGSVQGIDQ